MAVPPGSITISLKIENTYQLYPDVVTEVTDQIVPAPPPEDSEEYDDWVRERIHDHTGVGHTKGNSWYDVEVTACSDPALIGKTWAFGY